MKEGNQDPPKQLLELASRPPPTFHPAFALRSHPPVLPTPAPPLPLHHHVPPPPHRPLMRTGGGGFPHPTNDYGMNIYVYFCSVAICP